MEELSKEQDFYWEGSFLVFTRQFHLRRGSCCGSGCRHCPYDPRWTKGTTTVSAESAITQPPDQCEVGKCF
ncbi:MAG: hypothetical protein JNK38_25850 [Acidobacteria bacterium]|nr:hypothetical protein [Acidobacteriota bacterium]